MTLRLVLTVLSLVTLALSVAGCGYSEDEWKAQLAKYEKLAGEHRATQDDLTSARQRIQALEDELQKAGVDISQLNRDLESKGNEISQLSSTLDERTKALAEYRRRAEQLERIKARFVRLRKKLQALTDVGLEVKIRNNRMIISLPGDVLFESAKDDLKEEGKDVLKKVARIITADAGLRARLYQVAGHTRRNVLRQLGPVTVACPKGAAVPDQGGEATGQEVERCRLCRYRSYRQQCFGSRQAAQPSLRDHRGSKRRRDARPSGYRRVGEPARSARFDLFSIFGDTPA